jgi:D-amino-acid dehydrogenase
MPHDAPDAALHSSRNSVVVVGGGVVGAACASFLAEAGAEVMIIDRGRFGQGCSHGNCGYVSPSHVLPLCRPGAIGSTLKMMFRRNAPFKLRLRLDPAQWAWLWRFARHCNTRDMLRGGHALSAMLNSSRQLYEELIAQNHLTDCEWEPQGLLFVFRSAGHFEHFAETDRLLRETYQMGATRLPAEELAKLEPALKPDAAAGAWLYDCDAHLRPDKLMSAWQRRLNEQGVTIRENCEFQGFERTDGKVTGLVTSQGRIEADQVVIATGAWTPLLKEQLGKRVPIEPGKGYSITMPRPALCPKYPMVFEQHRVAVTPMQSGYRIGSTMEFAGFDETLREERLHLLTEGAKLYLKEPLAEPIVEKWYGWRPMSCDGVPFIGPIPKFTNVWLAAGHSMLGVSMATGTGRLIAELVTGATPHVDPAPYRVDRF